MSDVNHEEYWSPFDPKWYNKAFDKYISGGDELFKVDSIISEGYHIPDIDGSKSTAFRNDAVLNNTFNEEVLKETLFDIYNNSSHKLIASNHDNVHFFQWHGNYNDFYHEANSPYCLLSLPVENVIKTEDRDRYKSLEYLKKWINITDVLNDWETFGWNCLVFVNGKVSSEYSFHIDDKSVILRIPYYKYWEDQNYRIDVYKFDTEAQCRVKISKELILNQLKWKIPINYLDDKRIGNASKVLATINKISDLSIREDGNDRVEILSNNIDFLDIKKGYIDLSKMSDQNKIYLESEPKEWLWLSLSVPKFFHEYPIVLPADYIYRPYEADFRPVNVIESDIAYGVKTDTDLDNPDVKQTYVDMNGEIREKTPLWRRMIRPVVLSDIFNGEINEDYSDFLSDVDELRDSTVGAADIVEKFRLFLKNYTTDRKFNELINEVKNAIIKINEADHKFMDKYYMEYDDKYEYIYQRFIGIVDQIIEDGYDNKYLHEPSGSANNFFDICAECIFYVRDLCDEYNVLRVATLMPDRLKVEYENILDNRIRFQRPIDVSDFWTFEFDMDTYTWKPYPLEIEYHYPDVYILKDPNGDIKNKIFKVFLFYSDTINILNESRECEKPSPDWSDNIDEYYVNQRGTYQDIFMEKFYWMAIKSIYQGILRTNSRWEVIEYIIDNPSYNRFNKLFVDTMDPYFKLGLATYLKSDNLNFPFDEEISKLKEAIDQKFLDYKRVTNFEQYLENDWVPSYFDYVVKILDNWNYATRLIRRPKNVFDINRLLPLIRNTQTKVYEIVRNINSDLQWVLDQLEIYNYDLDIDKLEKLLTIASDMNINMQEALDNILDLDLEIYSIQDINKISELLSKHFDFTDRLNKALQVVDDNVNEKFTAAKKKECLSKINELNKVLRDHLENIIYTINNFDVDEFLRVANDLNTYIEWDKNNPSDISLIGEINKFEEDWPINIKEARNDFYINSVELLKYTIPNKSYTSEEIIEFHDKLCITLNKLSVLEDVVKEFFINKDENYTPEILNKFYGTEVILNQWKDDLDVYLETRNKAVDTVQDIRDILNILLSYSTSKDETNYINSMKTNLSNIVEDISHLLGTVSRDDAFDQLDKFNNTLAKYFTYVEKELEVFDRLFRINSTDYIGALLTNKDLLEAAIQYMNTANEVYKPNSQAPDFASVYSIDAVKLSTPGFMHKVGDLVYIPNIGVYKINEVVGTVAKATVIENMGYYNTSIMNPFWSEMEYEGITNGEGLGLRVVPIHVVPIKIINDEAVNKLITEVIASYYSIINSLSTPNNYDNRKFRKGLEDITNVIYKWNRLQKIYSEYMTDNIISYMDSLVEVIKKLPEPCQEFIDARASIFVEDYIDNTWNYIVSIYTYFDKHDLRDDIFKYYDDKIREAYINLNDFYGSGIAWDDGNELKELITNCSSEVISIFNHLLSNEVNDEYINSFTKQKDEIVRIGDDIKSYLNIIPEKAIPVNSYMKNIYDKLNNVPELQKDEWYSMSNPAIAEEGNKYKVGDIVSITTDHNDTLLFQVAKVDFERVTHVTPLIKYALQYDPSGIYETETCVGIGFGLKLNIRVHEISIDDNTILNESKAEYIEPFDENDLLQFKFENAHDLDIGYEVYFGGVQSNDFILRHEQNKARFESSPIDVIYLNANQVMKLKEASVHIPEVDYYNYYINSVNIKDPGAGYCKGQTIVVGNKDQAITLEVDEVTSPLKGIKSISFDNTKLNYHDNPSIYNGEVVSDDMCNIDDEYHKDDMNDPYIHTLYETDKPFGDPDENYMAGSESNEILTQRIDDTVFPIDGIIKDSDRIPPNVYDLSDIQEIARIHIHDSTNIDNTNVTHKGLVKNKCIVKGDYSVPIYKDLPRYTLDYPNGKVGSKIIVENDETHHGHRMLYTIRTFLAYGYFVYDKPELADYKWNTLDVKWNDADSYVDLPTLKALYPSN